MSQFDLDQAFQKGVNRVLELIKKDCGHPKFERCLHEHLIDELIVQVECFCVGTWKCPNHLFIKGEK